MLIDILPQWVILNLNIYGLILIGYLVERKFVSRPALFANAIALNSFFIDKRYLLTSYPILEFYVDLGLIWGVIAILKYAQYQLGTGDIIIPCLNGSIK